MLFAAGFSGWTGDKHSSSNSRIVRLSMTPAAWMSSAVSCIAAIRGLPYRFFIACHVHQRSRRGQPRDSLLDCGAAKIGGDPSPLRVSSVRALP